jgi:hypothetical protein
MTNKESRTTNVQPALLIKLMKESEPCLFSNKSEPAVSPVEKPVDTGLLPSYPSMHPWIPVVSSFPKMVEITRWHADLQIQAWRELVG